MGLNQSGDRIILCNKFSDGSHFIGQWLMNLVSCSKDISKASSLYIQICLLVQE